MRPLICFSHLRWNFVWQRPQHLLSRLSKVYKIYFIEEPAFSEQSDRPELEIVPTLTNPNIVVIRLVLPGAASNWVGHGDNATQPIYNRFLNEFFREQDIKQPLLWFYTPMALDFLQIISDYKLLIYDVMDQLAAFKDAPAELLQREKTLLKQADIVLTGGVSLYRSKLPFNKNTYVFPSGVEIEHYAAASNPANFNLPPELEKLKRPILGYFGVIDERIDQPLIDYIARAHPDWTILMIGPVVKIDPDELPVSDNLLYLGMRPYDALPSYLAFFDAALIPFALNEATEYLSPTKTLEYLAAGKPVISTPINDVIELYGEVVRIARNPIEFVEQVEAALKSNSKSEADRVGEILNQATWDSIAAKITELIGQKLEYKNKRGVAGR